MSGLKVVLSVEVNPTSACDAGLDLMLAGTLGRYDIFPSSFQKSSLFSTP